jgi:MFS family permease
VPDHLAPAADDLDAPVSRDAADGPGRVWGPGRRRLTAALVLAVTLVAFESLAISTVMPVVADHLGQRELYGWVFSGFFLGSLLGAVVGGGAVDDHGARRAFGVGLALFTVGLVVGGRAPTMAVLVLARVVQGMGAGVIPAVSYAVVGLRYPPALRPRVFAVFSTAWVVPGLVGPAAASAIERLTSWRMVFLALVPVVAVAAAMALPVLPGRAPGAGGAPRPRRRLALVLVAGVAAVFAGVEAEPRILAVALVPAGAAAAAWAYLRLVPAGTVTLQPGLPAAVAVRGILTFAFFGTDAFLSLAVTGARGRPTWLAGLVLTGATLTWTAGSWVQQRWIAEKGPRWFIRWGFVLVALGVGGSLAGLGPVPVEVLVPAWALAGLGMGLAYSPISLVVLGSAAAGAEGNARARGWATGASLTAAFSLTLAVAAAGALAAGRLPVRLGGLTAGG